ncbi:MAG: hypothetical protein AAF490_03525 [Chloroflexota bacterium]
MNFLKPKRWILVLFVALLVVACGGDDTPTVTEEETAVEAEEPEAEEEMEEEEMEEEEMEEEEMEEEMMDEEMMAEADLDAVKAYAVSNAENMKAGSEQLLEAAGRYYQLVSAAGFDYDAAFDSAPEEIPGLIAAAQAAWLATSESYELDEGIIAGTPSLAYYDVLIDAGASAADDPEEALEWNLLLPDGRVLESPGNYFHSLLEPALFGTNDEYVGGVVNGIAMPEANLLLGAATGLDTATGKMLDDVNAWEPTLSDAFTALVVMTPTMNEYFEQWKLSSFVSGDAAEETAFVGQSRLFDVVNILNGLGVTYENVSPLVIEVDSDLHDQIAAGYSDLQAYVGDLYQTELDGSAFGAEEADLFGTEAQDQATAISGQVSQAAAQLEITVDEEFELVIPASATVDQGLAEVSGGAAPAGGEADLDAVKAYALENAENMKAGSEELLSVAGRYFQLVSAAGFDYEAALAANPDEMPGLIFAGQAAWLATSESYELDEGIIAGTPTLAYYDVLIDAGASAADDPEEALEWNLLLPDGRILESPGNYFHSLLEPALFGTNDEFVGAVVGELVMPEANLLLGAATGLDTATGKMLDDVNAWEPTLSDAFTALVVMTPTMNEYFEQWKLSSFVSGDAAEETAFVGQSRLFDVVNILNGLGVTYENVSPLVIGVDSDLHDQIAAGYVDLQGFVGDLYQTELDGSVFGAEEADLFGTEAQDKATALSGQVSQAAAQLEILVDEEFELVIPASATVDQGVTSSSSDGADLAAVKDYAIGNAENMKAGSAELFGIAARYYQLVSENSFDYAAALEAHPEEIPGLIIAGQQAWLVTSEAYELDEGIIAGVSSLAFYDVLIDAGPSAEDDPEEALEWTLTLPDGTVLESPGNYFHSLLEPTLWGTKDEFVGAVVDGLVMPEANMFLGAAQGLDGATQDMLDAVNAWEPTLSDAFSALVVMIPTMNEYFEQWKLSSYVSGDAAEETAFIGRSRLFDVVNILSGLDVTYDNVSALVVDSDSDLHSQIDAGFADLIGYVDDLYQQELGGEAFTPEAADLFGTEAQDRATALSGQVAQAAALLEIEIVE